jgi:hypothetical protein
MRYWWAVALVFTLLVLILLFVFLISRPAEKKPSPEHPPAPEQQLTAERFYDLLAERQLRIEYVQMACPIDGTVLEVPELARRHSRNRFGGVATDLMSISLAPPAEGRGRPDVGLQDWEALLVTCPLCGATYHGIDIFHLQQATRYRIDEWELSAIAPALAARPSEDWTTDERIYTRLLTQRAGGVPSVELGFTALQGAYAANFGTWYGKTVRIPSPAFYALAAAYFADALVTDSEMQPLTRASTALPLGECYRLLGRPADAAETFALVRSLGAFDESNTEHRAARAALSQLEQLLAAEDYSLHRAEIPEFDEPPVGWYIDEMLPAINGHIAQHRADWAALGEIDALHQQILDLLAEP